ncbi:MAG: 2-C-methyl-D-erythritol 2,4-cyclodiphosphate synthase [Porticoccaceae bacterium]
MRIGHGYDVHAFGEGNAIVIGGVNIPHQKGLVAHSDGDVLIHALCDALLGAAGLGDIGKHFPDTDVAYKNADSRQLLRTVIESLTVKGWVLGNADLTLVAQAPKMSPHIPAMIENLAADCLVEQNKINIKATTTERLGFAGREEGIACYAVVLIMAAG